MPWMPHTHHQTTAKRGALKNKDKDTDRSVWYLLWLWLIVVPFRWTVRLAQTALDYRWEISPVLLGVLVANGFVSIFGDANIIQFIGYILGTAAAYPLIAKYWSPEAREVHNAHRAMLKFVRNWPHHTKALGLTREDHKGEAVSPKIQRSTDFGGGSCRLDVKLPRGMTSEDIERKHTVLAGAYNASDVQVDQDPQNASKCSITFIGQNDPLYNDSRGAEIFHAMEPGLDPETPIPVGYVSTGETEYVTWENNNFLIGGSPGGGKSVGVRPFLTMAALSKHTQLWLADPKRVEFVPWREVAEIVTVEKEDTTLMLDKLIKEMMKRYDHMASQGTNYLPPSKQWPRIVLVVDEVAELTTPDSNDTAEKKLCTQIQNQLGRIVALGRAAGIVPILCTQKPDATTILTKTRDNIAIRLCFRCGNEHQAGTILGDDAISNGATPHLIAKKHAGLGFMTSETGGKAKRFKSFYIAHDTKDLPNSDVIKLVAKAAAWRRSQSSSA